MAMLVARCDIELDRGDVSGHAKSLKSKLKHIHELMKDVSVVLVEQWCMQCLCDGPGCGNFINANIELFKFAIHSDIYYHFHSGILKVQNS